MSTERGRKNREIILEVLEKHPDWGRIRIHQATGIPRSTVQGHLEQIRKGRRVGQKIRGPIQQQVEQRVLELETALARERKAKDMALAQLEEARGMRKPPPPRPGKPRARRKDDIVRVVASDLHGMKQHAAAVQAFLGDLKVLDPDELILNGDMTDCGGFLAQHHTLGYVAEVEYSYEEDTAAANRFLDACATQAPHARLEMLEGNHEGRVERWAITQALKHKRDADLLTRLVSPETLLRLQERGITYYRRGHTHGDCRIPGWVKKGKCFYVHEISSAKNAAAAAVTATAGNVVYAHTHRPDYSTLNLPGVGLVGAWNPGCLCEMQPLWRHTRPTNWAHGYLVQFIARTGNFLNIQVPISEGNSLLGPMLDR